MVGVIVHRCRQLADDLQLFEVGHVRRDVFIEKSGNSGIRIDRRVILCCYMQEGFLFAVCDTHAGIDRVRVARKTAQHRFRS